MIDKIPGIIIIERFDSPERFIAVNSRLFFIFKKNQIPDIKITNGKKLFSKLGRYRNVSKIGILMPTPKSLKKLISSNKFIMKPKQKKMIVILITTLINSLPRYLFTKKDLIMVINANFHI